MFFFLLMTLNKALYHNHEHCGCSIDLKQWIFQMYSNVKPIMQLKYVHGFHLLNCHISVFPSLFQSGLSVLTVYSAVMCFNWKRGHFLLSQFCGASFRKQTRFMNAASKPLLGSFYTYRFFFLYLFVESPMLFALYITCFVRINIVFLFAHRECAKITNGDICWN